MPNADAIEQQLREYYEAEASDRLRPRHEERRRNLARNVARGLAADGVDAVIDIGAGPASDHEHFVDAGVRYVGIDLAIGNAELAAEAGRTVIPASLFSLPFHDAAFGAAWSMSTLQHVPDERIDEALAELVRVLQPGAPVTIGLWGGRDEVITSNWASTGLQLSRHFTLRSHDRIRAILGRHLVIDADDTFASGPSDWEYHVAYGRTRR